jgi:hypothetical protein
MSFRCSNNVNETQGVDESLTNLATGTLVTNVLNACHLNAERLVADQLTIEADANAVPTAITLYGYGQGTSNTGIILDLIEISESESDGVVRTWPNAIEAGNFSINPPSCTVPGTYGTWSIFSESGNYAKYSSVMAFFANLSWLSGPLPHIPPPARSHSLSWKNVQLSTESKYSVHGWVVNDASGGVITPLDYVVDFIDEDTNTTVTTNAVTIFNAAGFILNIVQWVTPSILSPGIYTIRIRCSSLGAPYAVAIFGLYFAEPRVGVYAVN